MDIKGFMYNKSYFFLMVLIWHQFGYTFVISEIICLDNQHNNHGNTEHETSPLKLSIFPQIVILYFYKTAL